MSESQVVSIRPAEQEVAQPAFVPSITSSPANIYIQEVQAQTSDERRMAFTWRSPSSNLVLSPLAFVRYRLKIAAPYKITQANMVGTAVGVVDEQHDPAGATTGANAGALRAGYSYRPLLCFGEGNAPECAIESLQIGINGAVWSQLSQNLYARSLSRCFEPADVQQKAYSTCGGSCLRFDEQIVSGHVLGLPDNMVVRAVNPNAAYVAVGLDANRRLECAGADNIANSTGYRAIEGMTADSSLSQRMDNFHSQVVSSGAVSNESHEVTVEIRFPLQGGPFNSLFGASGLSRSDIRLRQALGICHYNQGSLTITYADMIKHVIRRLGRPKGAAGANATRLAGGVTDLANAKDIKVTYDDSYKPRLELTYIRLPSFRSYPQSAAITVCRRDVRRPEAQVTGERTFSAGLFDSAGDKKGLKCAVGLNAQPSGLTMHPEASDKAGHHEADVVFSSMMFPQVPDQLLFVFQKSSSVYNLQNPLYGIDTVSPPASQDVQALKWTTVAARNAFDDVAHTNANLAGQNANLADAAAETVACFNQEIAGRYISQNQASNAAIMQIDIRVQSAIGSFSFRTTQSPYLQDRDILWKRHTANCCDDYMPAGRQKWQERASCALLSSSDWLLGLQTSSGVVFPILVDATVKFANRAAVSSGLAYTNGQTKGKQVYEDFMIGDPCCVAIFNKQILSIASSSAVLSAQAFSQSTYASAISQQG